jgi:predicted metal-dependent enzyme (double-stranded beta helix superfamily)
MSKIPEVQDSITRRRMVFTVAAAASALIMPLQAVASPRSRRSAQGGQLDIDRFVEDCTVAMNETDPQAAVMEVLKRAVENPSAALAALGEPTEAAIRVLHRSDTLTIFSATWTPQMNLMPHNHLMWANIGIYSGREDNILWRATSESIEAFGAKVLFEGDVAALPANVIHSVTNPLPRFTGGIHIYGGDFFDTTRNQWDPETLEEEPSNGAMIREIFERENERMRRNTIR